MPRILAALAALAVAVPAAGAPCIRGVAACSEWVELGNRGDRSLVYRSFPLDTRNDRIRRVLVIVHGAERQAGDYFELGLAAARLEGALDDTLVIAPRFASSDGITCRDTLAAGELNWPCDGNSWRSGGFARGSRLTSFDLADEILRQVSRRSILPNLRAIVVAGHSAGGQFVTRYQMANRVHDTLGVPVSYVVANPSSYAYPEAVRPVVTQGRVAFKPFGGGSCASFDWWPYGLGQRMGYTEDTDAAVLARQLKERPATYLLGEDDIFPVALFDSSCAAMAQGGTRLARGRAFAAYVNDRLGGHHALTIVPACGHDAGCMFTANASLPALFPKTESH
jgi:pimeloyl-ACP methyl ester carboxylesterase